MADTPKPVVRLTAKQQAALYNARKRRRLLAHAQQGG